MDNFADKRGADHPGTCETYPKANRAKFNLRVTVLISAPDDIALPRTDRLAALPLPNPLLRRAVRTLSRCFWLSVPDGSGWRELAGGRGKGAHRVPTRSAPFPWRLARIAEL